MKKLNYTKLMALKPTVLTKFTNREGQEIELVEHPTQGDLSPVIIVYHDEKIAVISDFFDTNDLLGGADYEPIYMYGEMNLAYEIGL
jgi:hypothetical protein